MKNGETEAVKPAKCHFKLRTFFNASRRTLNIDRVKGEELVRLFGEAHYIEVDIDRVKGEELVRLFGEAHCIELDILTNTLPIYAKLQVKMCNIPSISTSSWLRTLSATEVPSFSAPRVTARPSISSKNIIAGEFTLAFAKIDLTAFSDSPTHLLKSSGPLTARKFSFASEATARAIMEPQAAPIFSSIFVIFWILEVDLLIEEK
ncbi:hypothetical protein IEQ34_010782 [Dendrobium chrysotoxum]|uniref:Uncharacterized protein n=1 Tax=Dendrobium chrysotoxum TaxID=161865 RepID=A0AAV7GWE2_DENCH|nr:hypothetical protein IEQ34_010782 [Dendrobium chrysotoxum]